MYQTLKLSCKHNHITDVLVLDVHAHAGRTVCYKCDAGYYAAGEGQSSYFQHIDFLQMLYFSVLTILNEKITRWSAPVR